MSSAGKIAMEEEWEPFLMTVEVDRKLVCSAMIYVLMDTQGSDWTATNTALQASEMMDSTADLLNMAEELDSHGSSQMV